MALKRLLFFHQHRLKRLPPTDKPRSGSWSSNSEDVDYLSPMTYKTCNAEDSCLKNHSGSPEQATEVSRGGTGTSSGAGDSHDGSDHGHGGHGHDPEKDPALRYGDLPGTAALTRLETKLEFPEGGLQAWLVVFGSFCAMLSVFGLINTAAVFESYFSENQLSDYTASEIGWIFSLYLFVVFFVGIQVGPVFDKYGPRLVVAIGGVLMAGSLLILSVCEAYGAIAHFFNVKRGFATGIAATAGSIGGIVFPVLLQKLLPKLGFGWTARILGFILLGLAVPANLFIRSRLPPRDKLTSVWPDLSVFKDMKFTISAVGIFFMEWGLFVPLTYIVSYAARYSASGNATDSYTLLSIMNAGSALGRFIPGFVADKIGRFNVIIFTIAMCIVTTFGLWLPAGDSEPMLIAFAVLFGFASGSNLGLIPVCLGQLCDPRDYGRFLSTAMMVASFGTLSSLPIAGAILEAGGRADVGWRAVIAFGGLSYVIALGCYMAARVMAVGWSLKKVF
ncbi:riboflavin transporter MCH5 [Verticillium alfalfae VaMs.102]|uniref:Riboflavin transporter MCH5 n=1 Tax=Verticillium alfalfae (strain VaMs.102 / ATCC MYA-4576 / FGSC 10136) TaxID=526221 RepID=C9SQ51_VERA1|nr:riboflavin transporter MCH5 [Verticillium alfalfae VaMs.102]EEY20976.1 riboflavin transporter MCH5 [Verticillium alfalfae VaMs.102]